MLTVSQFPVSLELGCGWGSVISAVLLHNCFHFYKASKTHFTEPLKHISKNNYISFLGH